MTRKYLLCLPNFLILHYSADFTNKFFNKSIKTAHGSQFLGDIWLQQKRVWFCTVFYTALCAVLSCIFLLTPRCLMKFFLSWACLWKPHYSKNHFSLFIRGPSYGWVPFMKNVWHCPFIVLTVCLLCVVLSQHCVN